MPRAQREPLGGAQGRAQHHDEPQGRRQTGELHRRLRRSARASGRIHRRADRGVREARHARHLVRACIRRHAARAADSRHAPGRSRGRRRQDARHRRGGRGAGAQIPGRLQRRARRRAVPRRMDRLAIRRIALRGLSRHQAASSIRSGCSIPARSSIRRGWTTRRCFALRRPRRRVPTARIALEAGARLVGLERAERSADGSRSSAPGSGGDNTGGFAKAVEMCNNNGHCRKFDAGTMCPSYRVTRDEQHLTRGRANTLRLALSGQLGRRCVDQRSDVRRHGSVRRLQGLQARMSDRRRHGAG